MKSNIPAGEVFICRSKRNSNLFFKKNRKCAVHRRIAEYRAIE